MRGAASASECPKSLVTPESIEMLEKFFASKAWGWDPTAREADGFWVLEQELRAEGTNGH